MPRRAGLSIFLAAACVRLLHLYGVHDSWAVRYHMVDARAYRTKALAIWNGDWLGSQIFYQDPLYPYWLALLYTLFGPDSPWVLIVQALIDAGTVVLVFEIARRVFGARVAWLAAPLAVFYKPLFYFEVFLDKATLSVFLLTLALLLLLRADERSERMRRWLPAGAALGVAALTRGQYLALAPVVLIWIAAARRRDARQRAASVAAFALGVVLALLPVTLRNAVVGREFVLTQSGAGANLYIGNFRGNDSGRYHAPPFVRPHPAYEEHDFHAEAERRAGRPLSPSEVSRFWLRATLAEIEADPAHFARHTLRKAHLYANHFEVPDNESFYYFQAFVAPWLAWPGPSFGALLPFALVGLATAPRTRGAALVAAVLFVYSASVIAFFVASRYRLPIAPLVIAFAAQGIAQVVALARERKLQRLAALAVLWLFAAVFVNQDIDHDDLAFSHFNLGGLHHEQASSDMARARQLAAAGDAEAARVARMQARSFLGLAEDELRQARATWPENARVQAEQRAVLQQRIELARDEGDADQALAAGRALVAAFPNAAQSHVALAEICLAQQRYDEARAALRRAHALAPALPRVGALRAELDALEPEATSPPR